jgi:hypothetical protein
MSTTITSMDAFNALACKIHDTFKEKIEQFKKQPKDPRVLAIMPYEIFPAIAQSVALECKNASSLRKGHIYEFYDKTGFYTEEENSLVAVVKYMGDYTYVTHKSLTQKGGKDAVFNIAAIHLPEQAAFPRETLRILKGTVNELNLSNHLPPDPMHLGNPILSNG